MRAVHLFETISRTETFQAKAVSVFGLSCLDTASAASISLTTMCQISNIGWDGTTQSVIDHDHQGIAEVRGVN